ncbi:NAD+ synthase [Verrucomicrobia bacterium]|nr:NAD+ synthase [Verrucomicrobiota bacterium]|tara:strand:- start:2644 stop:4272 length:1629 start_codon:yes stop_codon:yes gene_type:complete
MKIGIAQLNNIVGDLSGNAEAIVSAYNQLVAKGADIVITPELSLTGYPPRDLVFKSTFVPRNLEVLESVMANVGPVPLMVGYVDFNTEDAGKPFENAVAILQDGKKTDKIIKCLLPTYDVFDEARYFQPSKEVKPVMLSGLSVGVTICEDVWSEDFLPSNLYVKDPAGSLVDKGIDVLLNLSASPFHSEKPKERHSMLSFLARRIGVPVIYCNAIGGNDQLVFDGNSAGYSSRGEVITQCPGFCESLEIVDTEGAVKAYQSSDRLEELFNALVLGLRDYIRKCGFKKVVIGLSGGIDSALTAALAAEALGAKNVLGVTMPSEFSSSGSVHDSESLANNLGITFEKISIGKSFESLKNDLSSIFSETEEDITEENMQARLRGLLLMSISNKKGCLLLTTGNKSELAVGYCTIYGDMCGGLAVISDLPKMTVYELSRWINREEEIIPRNTIDKPPSAELRPDQKDQDTLPEYELLDQILEMYIDDALSVSDIINRGYDKETVDWISRRVDLNEWKRGQAAPGLRVTSKAFGIGRRIPIAQNFRG